jgi:hypothetical protein
MFKKLARSAAFGSVAAGSAAAAVGVGAFALYAALKDPLGQAGAAGVVALLFLLVAIIAGLMIKGGGDKAEAASHAQGPDTGDRMAELRTRAITLARQRPLIAGAVGLVGALYVLRNPALVTGLVGLLAGRAEGKHEVRRGWF